MVPHVCFIFAVMFFTTPMTVKAGESEEAEEATKACISLMNPDVAKCCAVIEEMGKEKKEKCNIKNGEMTCENAKCFLKEDGLDGEDIDQEKISQKLEELVKEHEELKDVAYRIKNNCLDRKFEEYPPKDCPAASLILCTYLNSITECPEWKDSDQCQKFAEEAKICKNAIDSM